LYPKAKSAYCSARRALLLVLVLLAAMVRAAAASPPDFGFDLHGKPILQLAGPGVRVIVLVFAGGECPISDRYIPEIARLSKEFSTQGVRFWWVYPNAEDTASVVEKHNREFSISEKSGTGTVLDSKQTLVTWAHSTVTPEAAVFVVEGDQPREVYHGRIDDRYLSLGQERPQAGRHELETAIGAALAGKPVPRPGGPPVGCSIAFLQK
jgi:hypothetical protein